MPSVCAAAPDGSDVPVEWVEWRDEPYHETLFEVHDGLRLAARVYAARYDPGAANGHQTLFHRHAHDTAYVCLSAAADDEADAEVWNEELQEVLSEGSEPKYVLLSPKRVYHSTGLLFCNCHTTAHHGNYIHRVTYAPSNPRPLEFVGIEVHALDKPSPVPPVPPLARDHPAVLSLAFEVPGLFRGWRLSLPGGQSSASCWTAESEGLGGGFGHRGGVVTLIQPLTIGPNALEVASGLGGDPEGPFGQRAVGQARAVGGWTAAGRTTDLPAGATWPVNGAAGRAPFRLTCHGGARLEALLVEFL